MYLRMIAICSALGARRRTLRTSRSASSSASTPGKSWGDLGSAITNVQRMPSGSSSLIGEGRQGRLGLVLVLADQEDGAGAVVGLELERGLARQVGRGDRRGDVLLDVLDDPVGPLEVADIGPLPRVVHRVGQVADQDDVLAGPGQVPQAERPAEHAHIRMNAHEHDVGDPAALEQVPDLDARVADRVLVVDLDGGDLRLPGRSLRALRPVVAAAVGLVDRVDPLLLGRDLVAPLADVVRAGSRPWGQLCARLRAG